MRRFCIAICALLSAAVVAALASSALADNDDQAASGPLAFEAVLSGRGEVPQTTSTGEGLVSLLLSQDNSSLYYTVEVTGASSTVNAAHIHLGRRGQNGDVVVNLCGAGSAPPCATEGVIATGTITSTSLVGPLAGGHSLNDLITAMRSGNTYSNVHTTNFPNGELRGQVQTLAGSVQRGNENGDANTDDQQGEGRDQLS